LWEEVRKEVKPKMKPEIPMKRKVRIRGVDLRELKGCDMRE
jgi:hypothetical protein